MTDSVTELREGLSRLNERDREFALSLLAARRPTDKQMYWIGILAERTKKPPERTKVEIGNMKGIAQMFAHYAAHHVKLPKIVLHTGTDMGLVVIHPAGKGSAYPGTIQVKEYEGERRWLGRIYADGKFELSPRYVAESVQPVINVLRELSEKPLETAAAHGRLTGRCCFCNTRLKDERSTEVGYGPVCAESFGLDWGSKRFAFAATPVEVVQEPAPIKVRRSRRNIKVGE